MKNQEIKKAIAEFDERANGNEKELIEELIASKFTKEEYLNYLITYYIPTATDTEVLGHLEEVYSDATIEDVKKAR